MGFWGHKYAHKKTAKNTTNGIFCGTNISDDLKGIIPVI
jgi:hypothetical protein